MGPLQIDRNEHKSGPRGLPEADTKAARSHSLHHVFDIVILAIRRLICWILAEFGVSGVENPDLPVFLYKTV